MSKKQIVALVNGIYESKSDREYYTKLMLSLVGKK